MMPARMINQISFYPVSVIGYSKDIYCIIHTPMINQTKKIRETMSKYKLNFQLKQHTPIIHFQHDQQGATLRASELKPKLDKFLIEKLALTETIEKKGAQAVVPKKDYEHWFNNKEKLSLDYKVRIMGDNYDNVQYYLPYPVKLNSNRYPNKEQNFKDFLSRYINFEFEYLMPSPFFANADKIKFYERSDKVDPDESKPNEIIFARYSLKSIDGFIMTFNSSLKSKIEKYLVEFFLITNFGTRQNKGFGSYTVSNINSKEIKTDNKLLNKIFLKKSTHSISTFNNLFKFILNEYNLLKSGTNRPYNKSELFKYYINNDIRWEKRFLKKVLNNNGVQLKQQNQNQYEPIDFDNADKKFYNNFKDNQVNQYQYIRALLGLAENFEFASYNRGRLRVKVKHQQNNIERFKSPIFCKVIDNVVYMSADLTYQSIGGETFEFFDGTTLLGSLNVPANFDIKVFINTHISQRWSNL